MSTALSPIVSEFETTEQENSYNEWLRAKVASSLADPRPAIPHDEVMAEMENLIAQIAVTNRSE
ncbi:antitoxin [Escherichia coli]|uniref:type II toxin-antitoxin system RelB family antitoxin n=1 Tax=Escherichia coli TaxID=562 RepID=UPI000B7FA72E|nr:antitoxin [Escherichia coli]EFA4864808.1 antitoxin [Escherichia coli]EFH6731498.1 antitoxin [Escherichia coli]EFJ2946917.1 antitoxin [Escherichia coli]EFJ3845660.1 antitoxin [Escherichia coli]EFK7794443.1 antitoxin [Escherichia coli]